MEDKLQLATDLPASVILMSHIIEAQKDIAAKNTKQANARLEFAKTLISEYGSNLNERISDEKIENLWNYSKPNQDALETFPKNGLYYLHDIGPAQVSFEKENAIVRPLQNGKEFDEPQHFTAEEIYYRYEPRETAVLSEVVKIWKDLPEQDFNAHNDALMSSKIPEIAERFDINPRALANSAIQLVTEDKLKVEEKQRPVTMEQFNEMLLVTREAHDLESLTRILNSVTNNYEFEQLDRHGYQADEELKSDVLVRINNNPLEKENFKNYFEEAKQKFTENKLIGQSYDDFIKSERDYMMPKEGNIPINPAPVLTPVNFQVLNVNDGTLQGDVTQNRYLTKDDFLIAANDMADKVLSENGNGLFISFPGIQKGHTLDLNNISTSRDVLESNFKAAQIGEKTRNTPLSDADSRTFNSVLNKLKDLKMVPSDRTEIELKMAILNKKNEFSISTDPVKANFGNEIDFKINFMKNNRGTVFTSYDANLTNPDGWKQKQNFPNLNENTITADQALNLLEGRDVKISYIDAHRQEQSAFIRLDFKNVNEKGNFKTLAHLNEVDTNKIVELAKIKTNSPDHKMEIITNLENGNIVPVEFNYKSQEYKGMAILNPGFNNIRLYNSSMERINDNTKLRGIDADDTLKINSPQQNIKRGH